MADIVITAASVIAGAGSKRRVGVAGATIAAGDAVYLDATDDKYKLADCDAAAALRSPNGFALNSASDGQPLVVHGEGPLTLGAVLTPGSTYYLSATPGKIAPIGDLTTGDYPTIMGIATSDSVLDVKIHQSGVALA